MLILFFFNDLSEIVKNTQDSYKYKLFNDMKNITITFSQAKFDS